VRAAFLLPDLRATPGVEAAIVHAAGLHDDHGVDARVVLVDPLRHPAAAHDRLEAVPVLEFAAARAVPWDVVLAVDAGSALAGFALEARARVLLLRENEASLLDVDDRRRLAAEMVTALPVHLLATSRWLADELGALRGGDAVAVVPDPLGEAGASGSRSPVTSGGPLRLLVVGAADDARSGVGEALHALTAMRAAPYVTWLAPAPAPPPRGVHRVLSGLGARARAALLADMHVVLHLPRAERCATPVLEAFRAGVTAVVSPIPAHEEVVAHARNGLIAGLDDVFGTAALLDLLAADRELLDGLRRRARWDAVALPDAGRATALLAAELRRVVDARADGDRRGAAHLMAYDMVAALADLQAAGRRVEMAGALYDELRAESAYRWSERARLQGARARSVRARVLRLVGR